MSRENRLKATKSNFLWFFLYYLPHYGSYRFAPFHYEMAVDIHDLIDGTIKELGWIQHRESAKTSFAKAFILYLICFRLRDYINVDSYDKENAERILFDVAWELQTNKRIIDDFGQIYTTDRSKFQVTQKRINNFVTNPPEGSTGIRVEAYSTQEPVRGRLHGAKRPDFICHEKGTKIYDGRWLNVEDHGGLLGIRKENGLEVKIHSLPYSEIVTEEHRYWIKTIKVARGKRTSRAKVIFEGWKEAKELTKHDFIGLPISYTENLGYIQIEKTIIGSIGIKERNAKGQIVSSFSNRKEWVNLPKEPLFWWIVGYWVGDGHITKTQVGFSVNDKDEYVKGKIKEYCQNYGKTYSIGKRIGCSQYIIPDTALSKWLRTWRIGNSQKIPPIDIERLPIDLQKEYIKGYIQADGWIDKKHNEVRLTSVCLEGLYRVRRMLARIGIASSIRHGIGPRMQKFPNGQVCKTQKKYDLRFRLNANLLGFDYIKSSNRYAFPETHISNGWLWSKVKSIKKVGIREFCPIKTETNTYQTHYGLSHNCLDDFETSKTIKSEAHTETIRMHIQEFKGGIDTAKGRILYLGNYLSEFANVQSLIERSKIDSNLRIRIVPIADELGNPTWPEKYCKTDEEAKESNLISIDGIKKKMWTPEHGDEDFMAEMMCQPIDYSNSEFKREWFDENRYYESDLDGKTLNNFMMFDNAPSTNKDSDWIGCVIISVDQNDIWYFRYIKRYRLNTPDLIDEMYRLNSIYQPKVVGFEQKAFEDLIKPYIEKRGKELKQIMYVVELKDKGVRKEDRIRGRLINRFATGRAKLKKYATDDTNEFVKEAAQFPNGKHDDLCDAAQYAVDIAYTPQKQEKAYSTDRRELIKQDIMDAYTQAKNASRETPDTI